MDLVHVHSRAQAFANGVAVETLHIVALLQHLLLLFLVHDQRGGLSTRRTVAEKQLRLER